MLSSVVCAMCSGEIQQFERAQEVVERKLAESNTKRKELDQVTSQHTPGFPSPLHPLLIASMLPAQPPSRLLMRALVVPICCSVSPLTCLWRGVFC